MKTIRLGSEHITVEFTEFELTALAALVERAQPGLEPARGDNREIRTAIHRVAEEFRSLLGHFELVDRAANE